MPITSIEIEAYSSDELYGAQQAFKPTLIEVQRALPDILQVRSEIVPSVLMFCTTIAINDHAF